MRYEIQFLASHDDKSRQVLADRCVIEAFSLQEAAQKYAALFDLPAAAARVARDEAR